MPAKTNSRNGFIRDASQLFAPSHRRREEVPTSDDPEHPNIVIVRSISATQRRRFINAQTRTDPSDSDKTLDNRDWFTSGARDWVLLALSCFAVDDNGNEQPLFPEAYRAAERLIQEPEPIYNGKPLDPSLEALGEIDPGAAYALNVAAERCSLVTMDALDEFRKSPLVTKTSLPSDSPLPLEAPIPTA